MTEYIVIGGLVFAVLVTASRYSTFNALREAMTEATRRVSWLNLIDAHNARNYLDRHMLSYMLRITSADTLVRKYTMRYIDSDLRYRFAQELNNVLHRQGLGVDPGIVANSPNRDS